MARPPQRRSRLFATVAAGVLALGVASCGSSDGPASAGGGTAGVAVVASFYPLQWMAERVGGDLIGVGNLTKAGAEPHDLELTPKDVAALSDADVVVYLSGFQPAVDEAIDESGATAFDAADHTDLDRTLAGADGDGAIDPHFWLDPTKLAEVATAFGATLAEQDPAHATTYRANAKALGADLGALDRELEAGLADCTNRDLVTSHEAFGYLAGRYDLEQVGITGLTPEQEPSAADLAAVTRFAKANDVRTIYFETLVSPAVAKTVATEAKVDTAVLDPLEGLTDDARGTDYLEVMRSNLTSLQAGQPCP